MKLRSKISALTLGLLFAAGFAFGAWTIPVMYHPDQATGDLLYLTSSGGKTELTSLAAVASGQVLTSAGTGTAPAWSAAPTFTSATIPTLTVSTLLQGDGSATAQGFNACVTTASSGTTAIAATNSGCVYVNTGTSSTTTFTLPNLLTATNEGLYFCFVEAGDAAGELLINVAASDLIVGKTHGAENGTGIATTAGTGIKNTAATNVKGDFTCLVGISGSTWVMTSVAGVWASQ